MTTFKNENSDWMQFAQEEHTLDEYLEKFGVSIKRENILNKVKTIIVKSDLLDLSEACITRQ